MQSKILKLGLVLHAIMAMAVAAICFSDVFYRCITGAIFNSTFHFESGLQYAVFNLMTDAIGLVIGLFAVTLCLAGFTKLVEWFTHMDVYREQDIYPKFYKQSGFWIVTVFAVIYAVLYTCNLASFASFEPIMVDGGDATLLLGLLFGPLIAVVFIGLAIAGLIGVGIMFVAVLSWQKLLRYVKDVVMSCDSRYVALMRTYDETPEPAN